MRLTAAAASDFEHIIDWTIEHFGDSRAAAYAETLSLAVDALADGPSVAGAKQWDEILKGLYSLHVARQGRKEATSSYTALREVVTPSKSSACCTTQWIYHAIWGLRDNRADPLPDLPAVFNSTARWQRGHTLTSPRPINSDRRAQMLAVMATEPACGELRA